jgi:hypothetical protein
MKGRASRTQRRGGLLGHEGEDISVEKHYELEGKRGKKTLRGELLGHEGEDIRVEKY